MPKSELRVLSAGAVKGGVAKIAADFGKTAGTLVAVDFAPAPELRSRIAAGEAADVVIVPGAMMDELGKQGKIVAESRGFVGRSRMGLVVHAGAKTPDLPDTAAFRKIVLGATQVIYNKASSGIYAAKLIDRLGLRPALASRIVVVDSGAAVMESVAAQAPGAVGLAQISEIMVLIAKGCAVKLAAPLPDEIQNETSYDAAVTAASQLPDAARRLARSLTSDSAKKVFAETGIG